VLLREQFRVGRIEFQQFLDIFQLCLRTFDVLVDTFQCFGQLGGIAADFYSDAFDAVCHKFHLLREGMKKAAPKDCFINYKVAIYLLMPLFVLLFTALFTFV